MTYTSPLQDKTETTIGFAYMREGSRCHGCMAEDTSNIQHVAHTYSNAIVVSVLPNTAKAYTMLRQTEWRYIQWN